MKAEVTIRDGRAVLVLSGYTGPEHDLLESMRPFLPVTQPRATSEWIVQGERMPGFASTYVADGPSDIVWSGPGKDAT